MAALFSKFIGGKNSKLDYLDISLYEIGTNKIHHKLQIASDPRFASVPWKKYFLEMGKPGYNIPINEAVEIVLWLQVILKIGIFL